MRFALAHFTLHEIYNLVGLRHRVLLRDRANDGIATVKEDHGRCDALIFGVRDDLRFSVSVDVGDCTERGSEVDTDGFPIELIV